MYPNVICFQNKINFSGISGWPDTLTRIMTSGRLLIHYTWSSVSADIQAQYCFIYSGLPVFHICLRHSPILIEQIINYQNINTESCYRRLVISNILRHFFHVINLTPQIPGISSFQDFSFCLWDILIISTIFPYLCIQLLIHAFRKSYVDHFDEIYLLFPY